MLVSLNIKDERAVNLISELATRLGKTKTAVIRELAQEKLAQLGDLDADSRQKRFDEGIAFLECEMWPAAARGRSLTKAQEEALLGYDDMLANPMGHRE